MQVTAYALDRDTPRKPEVSFGMTLPRELAAAIRLLQAKNGAEAEAILAPLAQEFARNADVWQLLAGALKLQERWDEALHAFEMSLALNPAQANVRNNHGNVLYTLGRHREALRELDEALRLQPNYADAHYNRALVLEALGREDEALAAVEQACRTGTVPARFHALRAKLLASSPAQDRADAAYRLALGQSIEEARKSVTSAPGEPTTWISMGDSLRFLGRHDEAADAYARAIEADNTNLLAHQRLNQTLWETAKHDRFLDSYRRVLARDAGATTVRRDFARQLFSLGRVEEAEEQLSQAMVHAGADWSLRAERGRARAWQGRLDGFADFAAVEGLAASEPSYWTMRADAELRFGRHDEALRSATKGLAIDAKSQELHSRRFLAERALKTPAFVERDEVGRLPGFYEIETPAGFSNLAQFFEGLSERLRSLHTTQVHPYDQTLRGGTQTLGALFARPDPFIDTLRRQITKAVGDYIARMPEDASHPVFSRRRGEFDFAGSWSACLKANGFHTNHIHPMGWISSALYVSLPSDVADATSKGGWFKIGESNMGLGADDRPERFVKPEPGLLVLFPSYLWHGTVPFSSDETRLTVAFDVVPKD